MIKSGLAILSLLGTTFVAQAAPPSVLGGAPMRAGTAHHVGVGWPSLFYEWWHAGNPDWAIGGELVYGDWSSEFSNVEIGLGINVPLRWHLHHRGITNVAFLFKPGVLMAATEGPIDDFVFGARGEIGVPVSVNLNSQVNLITGGVIPFTLYIVENFDPFVVIPILARIGVEVLATPNIVPYFVMELGPAMAFGDFGSEVEFGFRVWIGSTFW